MVWCNLCVVCYNVEVVRAGLGAGWEKYPGRGYHCS